jgi:hypothetical protein
MMRTLFFSGWGKGMLEEAGAAAVQRFLCRIDFIEFVRELQAPGGAIDAEGDLARQAGPLNFTERSCGGNTTKHLHVAEDADGHAN